MGKYSSTNTVDQLLSHTNGPAEPVTDRDLTRARSSAYIVHERLNQHIWKGYFLPDRDNEAAPDYARRGAFLWGLRNDFQHGDYWCLKVKFEGTQDGSDCYQLYFQKRNFEATPKGDLDSASDYLAHAPDEDQRYPLPYIGDFHRNLFSEFEKAFEEWCDKNHA